MKLLFETAVFFEKLMRGEVRAAHKLLDQADNMDRKGIEQLKNEAFLGLVKQLFENSNYYRDILLSHGYDLNTFKDINDIGKFPVLTKDIIKSKTALIHCNNIPAEECIVRNSGGTTGEPMKIEVNKQAAINDLYFFYRGLNWMGYSPGSPMVRLSGGSLSGNNSPTLKNRIKKFVSNEFFLPAFDLNKGNAMVYLDAIRSRGKTHLQGYVSSVYTLATYAKELNYKGLQIKGAFTTAEQLTKDQAAFIGDVFGCEVKGFFGCGEINSLGFQAKMNGNYIVPDEILHIETFKNPANNVENSFLLTSLYNYRTPLVRYLNGDAGKLVAGEKYTEIEELSGRTADMFVKKDGSYISSAVAPHMIHISGITQKIKLYQFIQHGIDQIEFRYELFDEPITTKEFDYLRTIFAKWFGQECHVEFVCTDQFIHSGNGKHRLMINKITA